MGEDDGACVTWQGGGSWGGMICGGWEEDVLKGLGPAVENVSSRSGNLIFLIFSEHLFLWLGIPLYVRNLPQLHAYWGVTTSSAWQVTFLPPLCLVIALSLKI